MCISIAFLYSFMTLLICWKMAIYIQGVRWLYKFCRKEFGFIGKGNRSTVCLLEKTIISLSQALFECLGIESVPKFLTAFCCCCWKIAKESKIKLVSMNAGIRLKHKLSGKNKKNTYFWMATLFKVENGLSLSLSLSL